uniref:Armadillo repeat-containing protein 2-like n=1 Tax=Stegastes partitus TaxID=144197 RepID=A0A3B5A5X6_9TELE
METKHEVCSPFIPRRSALRKTSAEIVSEARQALRVQSTHRPFTPRDGQRRLFGRSSVGAERDSRPPSTFSLHAQNFDAPDSRPGSGTRLAPLDHKPKFPVACDAEDPSKAFPKPPTDPVAARRGLAGSRARLLRAGSLTTLPPVEGLTNGKEGKQSVPQLRRDARKESHILWVFEFRNVCFLSERLTCCPELDILFMRCWPAMPGSPEDSLDRLCDLCDGLHGTLAAADMLGRRCKRRSGILRTLFRLIDLSSARLNLHIAELCLTLCVSGNNLLNICKLVFQISRSESNDVLFQSNLLLDVLCSEDVSASGEALLYCVGTLKFLSGNTTVVRLLFHMYNLVSLLWPLQLTATLRNLADHPESRPLFVSFTILPELCLVLRRHFKDQDICTNISRIYSKLSSYSECRFALVQTPDCYQLFLELLSKHHQKQDLVVRLLFTLGNLTAKSDESRQKLFQCDSCMDTLLRLYSSYQRRDVSAHTSTQEEAPPPCRYPTPPISAQEADDVLVKLVRLLANMCIHPAVGPSLARDTTCTQLLMETLGEHRGALTGQTVADIQPCCFSFSVCFFCLSSYKGCKKDEFTLLESEHPKVCEDPIGTARIIIIIRAKDTRF